MIVPFLLPVVGWFGAAVVLFSIVLVLFGEVPAMTVLGGSLLVIGFLI